MTTRNPSRTESPLNEVERFGIELRLARIRSGTYQKAIADEMGWHSTAISQLERGDRAALPDYQTVVKLDKFLNAEGALLAAAGYKAPDRRSDKPTLTYELPASFTRAEQKLVKDYIALIEKSR